MPPTLVLDAAAMTVQGRRGSVVARTVGLPSAGTHMDERAVMRAARAKVGVGPPGRHI